LLEDLMAAGDQPMGVPAVRHTTPVTGYSVKFIAVDNKHFGVEIGQYPGGQQAGHATTEQYRAFSGRLTHRNRLLIC
jgi:hypothetical protein